MEVFTRGRVRTLMTSILRFPAQLLPVQRGPSTLANETYEQVEIPIQPPDKIVSMKPGST